MKKDLQRERHEEEILNTRNAGFGGSDAEMVIAIADRLYNGHSLTVTQRKRLRVIAGIDQPTPSVQTADMAAGHDFEDMQQDALCGLGYTRERLLMPADLQRKHFGVFAHADYYSDVEKRVVECKWSRTLTPEEIAYNYKWQFQWYYMLGVQFVTLRMKTSDDCGDLPVDRDDDMVRHLRTALDIIDEQWDTIDMDVNETGTLPPDIAQAVKDMEWLKEEIATREAKYKELSASVRLWMEQQNVQKIGGERYTLTYTPATEVVKFDTKGLEKAYPKIYEQFKQYSLRSASVTLRARKEGE